MANYQSCLKQLTAVTEALERAHNTYRRLLLSLAEYRNPKSARNFTAFKQVNHAEQQVVQNNAHTAVQAPAQAEKTEMKKRRTKRDGARRRCYRLSPAGLAALRRSIALVKPWLSTRGPATPAGKDRAKMNALKHGERSAAGIVAARQAAALRKIRQCLRDFDDNLNVGE